MKILNFGSLNLDYTYEVSHFVRPGETLAAAARSLNCGGKGLNQAIALAKAGCSVYMAGAVGSEDGGILLNQLNRAGVNTDNVRQLDDIATGNAFIQVDGNGENCIVLYGGANQAVDEAMADEILSGFISGDWLILQNEISCLPYIMEKAHEKKMIIVLNPSPMNENVLRLPLHYVDYFLLNKDEAEVLSDHAEDPFAALKERYPDAKIVITRGSEGSDYWNGNELIHQGIFKVEAVDTTGAGDTFTGFFISSLVRGLSDRDALRTAAKASAIAVSRKGAGASVPSLDEVLSCSLKEI